MQIVRHVIVLVTVLDGVVLVVTLRPSHRACLRGGPLRGGLFAVALFAVALFAAVFVPLLFFADTVYLPAPT